MFGETNKNAEHFLIDGAGWGDWNSPTAPVHVCASRTSHIHMKDKVGSSVCLFPMTPPLCAQLCPRVLDTVNYDPQNPPESPIILPTCSWSICDSRPGSSRILRR